MKVKLPILIILSLLTIGVPNVYSQVDNSDAIENDTIAPVKFNHWSIAASAGISMIDGDQAQSASRIIPANPVKFSFSADVEYSINPIFGVNLQYNILNWKGDKGENYFTGRAHEASFNGTFNVFNVFSRCRSQKWNMFINVGVGTTFYNSRLFEISTDTKVEEFKGNYALSIPLGLVVEYNPTKWLGIYWKNEFRMYQEDNLDCYVKGIKNDNIATTMLGLRWKITTKGREHVRNYRWCDYKRRTDPLAKENQDRIDALEENLDTLIDYFNNLTPTVSEIAEANPTVVAPAVAEANEARRARSAEPRRRPSIYFDINSYHITNYAQYIIADIANELSDDSEKSIEIIGYCDKQGSIEYNKNLSLKRAEAIKIVLVDKFGIAAERISISGKGGIDGPKDDLLSNRRCDIVFTNK